MRRQLFPRTQIFCFNQVALSNVRTNGTAEGDLIRQEARTKTSHGEKVA